VLCNFSRVRKHKEITSTLHLSVLAAYPYSSVRYTSVAAKESHCETLSSVRQRSQAASLFGYMYRMTKPEFAETAGLDCGMLKALSKNHSRAWSVGFNI